MEAIKMTRNDGSFEIYTKDNYGTLFDTRFFFCKKYGRHQDKPGNPDSAYWEIVNISKTPCHPQTSSANLDSPKQTGAKQMTTIATEVVSPEVLAAKDVRVLDIIEDMLLDQQYDATMTDDIVLAVQEYLQDEKTNKSALALIADNAKLRGVFKFAQLVRNSEPFAALVAENEEVISHQSSVVSKPVQVVATGTTATAIAQQSQAKADNSKSKKGKKSTVKQKVETAIGEATDCPKDLKNAHNFGKSKKSKSVRPMPTIASLEALEAMDRKALVAAMGALNDNHVTGVRANGTTLDIKVALAKHILGVTYVAPAKAAKAPKASKAKKVEPILDLPEGLTWDEVRNMKYRQLQQLGKIFRSQGHEMPRLNSKGDDIRKAIANAMRSQGHDITEVAITSQGPAKDLNLLNWGAVKEQSRLERIATEALRMDATDAKVHMELAVAA